MGSCVVDAGPRASRWPTSRAAVFVRAARHGTLLRLCRRLRYAEQPHRNGPWSHRAACAPSPRRCCARPDVRSGSRSIDLPSIGLPGLDPPRTSAPAAPASARRGPRARRARRDSERRAARRRAGDPTPCDELPSEEEERRAQLPPLTALGRRRPPSRASPPPYGCSRACTLPAKIAAKVEQIDQGYARRTREHLVITSGTRDANRQARAMFTKLRLGEDLLQLTATRRRSRRSRRRYQANSRKPPEQVVAAMEAVIQDQIDRGISRLRAPAERRRRRAQQDHVAQGKARVPRRAPRRSGVSWCSRRRRPRTTTCRSIDGLAPLYGAPPGVTACASARQRSPRGAGAASARGASLPRRSRTLR